MLTSGACSAFKGNAQDSADSGAPDGASYVDANGAGDGAPGPVNPDDDPCPTMQTVYADAAPPPDTVCVAGGPSLQLTGSSAHCGACNHDCGAGATCKNSMCEMRLLQAEATGSEVVPAIGPTGELEWGIDADGGVTIRALAIDGSTPSIASVSLAGPVGQLMVDEGGYLLGNGGWFAAPLVGGEPVPLGITSYYTGMTATPSTVYAPRNSGGNCDVLAIPRDGGPPKTESASQNTAFSLATDGHLLVWMNGEHADGGAIVSDDIDGGAISTLVPSVTNGSGLAMDSHYVYFGEGQALRRVHRNGGNVETLAVWQGAETQPLNVTYVNGFLYWFVATTTNPGPSDPIRVLRVPACGGSILPVAIYGNYLTSPAYGKTEVYLGLSNTIQRVVW
jgi:hypothetical protein